MAKLRVPVRGGAERARIRSPGISVETSDIPFVGCLFRWQRQQTNGSRATVPGPSAGLRRKSAIGRGRGLDLVGGAGLPGRGPSHADIGWRPLALAGWAQTRKPGARPAAGRRTPWQCHGRVPVPLALMIMSWAPGAGAAQGPLPARKFEFRRSPTRMLRSHRDSVTWPPPRLTLAGRRAAAAA